MTVFETLDSERRRKWRHGMFRNKFFVVCKCPGGDIINCQMPGPWDSSCIKCPGFTREYDRGWNWLAHKPIQIRYIEQK